MRIRRTIFLLLVIVVLYWLLKKADIIPGIFNPFKAKPVVIDETPVLIKNIKSIGQLITYAAHDEVVADSLVITRGAAIAGAINRITRLPVLPVPDKKIVLIGRGKIMAGLNLARLTDSSISVRNDTVSIKLPPAEILDAILNPSDFETFIENGNWTNDEVNLVKQKARRKIIERALAAGILVEANDKAKTVVTDFITSMGYKQVVFL